MKKTLLITALFFLTTIELICQTQINYRITSMKQFTPEGIYNAEVEFIYNTQGQLAAAINYDHKGEIMSEFEYRYTEDGRLAEKTTVCGTCNSHTKHRYDYDDNGRLSRKRSYEASDELIEYTIFEYEDNKIKTWKVFDPYGQQTSYGIRKYNNNGTYRQDVHYSKEGSAISRMISIYGQSGMRSELQHYKNGSYLKMLFEYTGTNKLQRIKLMEENNALKLYLEIATEDNASYVDIFEFLVLWEM